MSEKPTVAPGDWIAFGNKKSAVICTVYEDASFGDIEVVFLDWRDRAINVDMVWKDGKWKCKTPQPDGGYADKYTRLSQFVSQLRAGRFQNLR